MSKFTGEIAVSSAASGTVMDAVLSGYSAYGLYVGLDVHKDTIAVALAWPGRDEAHYRGEIANTAKSGGEVGETTQCAHWWRCDVVLLRGGAMWLRAASPVVEIGPGL